MNNINMIKYHIGFEMNIIGCKLNFKIEDEGLLKSISKEDLELDNIELHEYEDNSILSGSIYTTNPIMAYNFILFEFKELIIKTLVIIPGIEDLRVEDNVQFSIINKQELIDAKLSIITCPSKFVVIEPEIPNILKENFEDSMRKISAYSEKFGDTILWQYISYSVTDMEKGKTIFDIISQYRLLWTSFNSLYNIICSGKGDKASLEAYSQKAYIVEYFKKLMNNYVSYGHLKRLAGDELTLRGKEGNVSDKLKTSMKNRNYEDIARYGVLCLYAIRNSVIHGTSEGEQNLCRVGFAVLNLLIKEGLRQEMLMMDK